MKTSAKVAGGFKCRHPYCPHRYNDVIAKAGWGNGMKGAECVPCLYAHQMVDHGQTIEQIEAVPHLMDMFAEFLNKTGWTWQHVKDSYQRIPKGLG